MSKERELLVRCRATINIRYDQVMLIRLHHEVEILLGEIEELLDRPEQGPIAYVADPSVGFDVSRSPQGMPLVWLGKLEYGDKLYRVGKDDE